MKETMRPQSLSLWRIIFKAIAFVILINYAFILFMQVPLGSISLYNIAFPGRSRFPFGENPSEAYSLSLYNLDAMIASHEISSSAYDQDEFNVFLIGDSSVWGYLQKPEETLADMLNAKNDQINIYNLGYPSLSVLKDVMILEKTKNLNPDLIVWLVTLESLPLSNQTETPLVENNPIAANSILQDYSITNLNPFPVNNLDFTLIGRRRELADMLRLQLNGPMWSATGIDQEYPEEYNAASRDFEIDDIDYYDFEPYSLEESQLALNIINQAIDSNKGIEFVVINEPILISAGKNSNIRYNFYYPRWAYDQYREIMQSTMDKNGREYYDFWDIVPENNFTNSAIHLDITGEALLAERVSTIIKESYEGSDKQ